MRLKRYRAADTAEAVALIRSELGPDAVILETRPVTGGVEVTTVVEPSPPAPQRAQALLWHNLPADLARRLQTGPLPFALSVALRFASLDLQPGAKPLLLVGPPGAGKTLSVARLATRLVMGGITPLVITTDGRRAGAAEQLAAFTRLLGLQLLVASTPPALARGLAHRAQAAPVLIDTPGTDPFDPAQREETMALAGIAEAEPVVVLPAGLDAAEAADLAGAYAAWGARKLIATRLDQARRLGGVLAAAQAGLALAEAGIGAGAADGLVPLTPDLLATRLLQGSGPRPFPASHTADPAPATLVASGRH
ncbi:Flagellar biosynthesis protein FlhF [Rhodovastum atsumiense]|uniref:GTP-binding protein n=1 Tax=Rhodovastum atsumiense TaxID=504468 RepID=A0A5M6IYM4_9PROT|nr:GTP-binding protein [Rhodovastum atsumiense]KAA5612475.1 GTP-binding protein [Rhodovastum atsumiense]CAH2600391.1 Flagellar biosynthesis protein FlhF [Rhodovastum atsumiense]